MKNEELILQINKEARGYADAVMAHRNMAYKELGISPDLTNALIESAYVTGASKYAKSYSKEQVVELLIQAYHFGYAWGEYESSTIDWDEYPTKPNVATIGDFINEILK